MWLWSLRVSGQACRLDKKIQRVSWLPAACKKSRVWRVLVASKATSTLPRQHATAADIQQNHCLLPAMGALLLLGRGGAILSPNSARMRTRTRRRGVAAGGGRCGGAWRRAWPAISCICLSATNGGRISRGPLP